MYNARAASLESTSTLRPLLALLCYPSTLYNFSNKPYVYYISVDLPLNKHTLYAYTATTFACFGSHLEITGYGVSFHHSESRDLVGVGFDVIKF